MTHDLDQFFREEAVRLVKKFCWRTTTPHNHAWRLLYERLEAKTGFVVPEDGESKLDHVAEAGLLEELHRLAEQLR